MTCFCQQANKESIFGAGKLAFGKDPENPDYICKDFNHQVFWTTALSSSLGYLIIAINYIIRELIIKIIKKVGEKTQTS